MRNPSRQWTQVLALACSTCFLGCGAEARPSDDSDRGRNNSTLTADAGGAGDGGEHSGPATGTVDTSRFGAECGAVPVGQAERQGCPADQVCALFANMGDSSAEGPYGHCVPAPACSIVTCADGYYCSSLESYPFTVLCAF